MNRATLCVTDIVSTKVSSRCNKLATVVDNTCDDRRAVAPPHIWTVQPYSPGGANVHPHVTHASLGPPESTTQTAFRSVQPFLLSLQHSAVHARACFSPKKLPLCMGRSGLPSNTWFLEPTRVLNPNGIAIGLAVFAGLTTMTDKPRYSGLQQ